MHLVSTVCEARNGAGYPKKHVCLNANSGQTEGPAWLKGVTAWRRLYLSTTIVRCIPESKLQRGKAQCSSRRGSPHWHVIAAASSLPPCLPVFFCFSVRLGFRRQARFLVSGRIQTFAYRGHVSCRASLAVVGASYGSTLPLCRQTSAALSCPACSSSSPSHTDYSFTSIRSPRLPHSLSS